MSSTIIYTEHWQLINMYFYNHFTETWYNSSYDERIINILIRLSETKKKKKTNNHKHFYKQRKRV